MTFDFFKGELHVAFSPRIGFSGGVPSYTGTGIHILKPFLARARGVDILTSVTDGHVLMHALRSYVSCDHVTLPIAAFFFACDLA